LSQSFVQAETKSDLKPILKIDSDKQFDFAEFYFSNKEYLRAIGEYKRFIYFFPKDKRVESAMYRIGMAYYYDRRFREAIDSFKKLIDKYVDTNFSIKSYFMTSESYLRINAFTSAIINLHNLITITDDVNLKDKAYYRIGWIYIEMASWEKARVYFEKISAQNKQKYRFEKLSTELEKVKYIPEKNPQIAGFLSVIPGAGYLYCKRYKDAIIAFLLNTGLIYAAYESFDDDQYALGGLITFVGFGFYAGSIYGSITSAHKYNRKRTEKFIKNLRDNTKVNISADLKNKSVYLSLQFSF
jgi:TolA-binding protein